MQLGSAKSRLLNHVEMVYRPGERALVARAFQLLGCRTTEGGEFLVISPDPDTANMIDNSLYASEITLEQQRLEAALDAELASGSRLAESARDYRELLARVPQRAFHFGIRFAELSELEATVERVRQVEQHAPELAGRIRVTGVFYPGDPGSYADHFVQAFVETNVVAAGLLAVGQHIELQWMRPPRAAREAGATA